VAVSVIAPLLDRLAESPPGPVEVRGTHTSWVLLSGETALKVRKPVQFAFLCRDGHGDLRAEHVVFEQRPLIVDRIEDRGCARVAGQLLGAYRRAGGDPGVQLDAR